VLSDCVGIDLSVDVEIGMCKGVLLFLSGCCVW